MKYRKVLHNFFLYLAIIIFLSFLLVPVLEMVFTSLQSMRNVFSIPHPLLPDFHFETYTHDLWAQVPWLPRYFLNSMIISTSVTLIDIILASPGAYGLSRFRFPGRRGILIAILASNMFSPVVLLVPLYKLMRLFHILNTYWALILPGAAFTLPFAVWMLTGYFEGIPKDLEEAAQVDGASKLRVLTKIVMPLAAPGLVTAAIYAFIVSWSQQFIFSLVFATDRTVMPITRGIYEYFGRNVTQWNTIMGASVIALIPVLVIFIFLQRYLIKGLTAGAIKG